jgi:segregation and condensation protein B
MDTADLKRILEAALLASPHPLSLPQLGALFNDAEQPGPDAIAQAVEALAIDAEHRGVALVEVASGFRYQVRPDVHPWVARLWSERPSKYSRALLETLALIAYRQPITRPEIEQIRGVVVSSNIIRTLEEREWIRVVGHRDLPGRPALYGTTRTFLDYFNLRSLDALPPLADIRDLDEMLPQFDFETAAAHVDGDPAVAAPSPATAVEAEASADAPEGTAPVPPEEFRA